MTLNQFTQPLKLFITFMLLLLGACYIAFLGGIYIDTEFKMSLIIEAYESFESMELTTHTFTYLTWFLLIFGVTTPLYFLGAASNKLKSIFAVLIPLLIFSDILCAALVRFSPFFAYQMAASGFALALCFIWMIASIFKSMWKTV